VKLPLFEIVSAYKEEERKHNKDEIIGRKKLLFLFWCFVFQQ
jgi:hypothetical protein